MKKRILLVTNGFPFGESERGFLSEEVRCLTKKFDLLVLAPDNGEELLYPTDGIARVFRYSFSLFRNAFSIDALLRLAQPDTLAEVWHLLKKRGCSESVRSIKAVLSFRFHAWEMERKIGEIIQTERIDLVYTYWCNECTLAAVHLKKRFPSLKVITRFHGFDLYEERTELAWQMFRKKIAEGADGLCFACEYGKNYFAKHWGTETTDKMHLCYLGSVDRGLRAAQWPNSLRIISCANLIPLKRVELIVEALTHLPKTMNVEWYHFGDGPERKKLEQLAGERLQNCHNIAWNFRGFIPNAMLVEEYRKLSPQLFVTTSSTEGGAPVSIQEAFSMGIPAIGTAVGGIPDLILDGKTGFLLPQNLEATDVANAILRFARLTNEQRDQMRLAAREHWANKFDAEKNAEAFAAYLSELISS